jgi:redox-regulated HSP33 family molecular chaperone
VYFQLLGFTFELSATEALVAVLLVSTIAFGYILGRFYKRYTRVIQFASEDDSALRIIVGRSDLTGKTSTLAANSSHNIEAKVTDDSSFKGWSVSGGVTVEDAKSFETTMEVNGDGLLKGLVAKKY